MRHPGTGTPSQVFTLTLGILGLLTAGVPARAGLLEDARLCTNETRRLERLSCFDEVFGTPLAKLEAASQTGPNPANRHRSQRWREAYAQVEAAPVASGVSYGDTGQAAGLLVTVPALGAQPPRPLLGLQCHNNITELTLILPEPLDAERVNLGLGTAQSASQNAWRVRDNGYALSIGRGLPAIRTVKRIGQKTHLRVYSENSGIDGLLFDLTGFQSAIRPLRERCGW